MKRLLLIALVISFLNGCYLKSVHPLITAEESLQLDWLNGSFESSDQRWTFASSNDDMIRLLARWEDEDLEFEVKEGDSAGFDGYLVLFEDLDTENPERILFTGYVGEINGDYYLNLKIFDLGLSSSIRNSHQFNVNTFSKIKFVDDELHIEFFKSSWIKDQILNNRVRIKHEVVYNTVDNTDEILVTASTRELKKFVEKYGDEQQAFEDPVILK